ncbi:MAG: hypothetical protein LC104_13600 [Bacteroidales bacterium]|nr:hypothetical protein [Bacteroidales bacterium]
MRIALFWGIISAAIIGCDRSESTAPPLEQTPLTQAEWKRLPPEEKYQIVTFERLKFGNPELYDEKKWNRFYRTEILPQQKKDFAKIPSKK